MEPYAIVDGGLDRSGDEDLYAIELVTGDVLTLDAKAQVLEPVTSTDTALEVLGSDGKRVAGNDDDRRGGTSDSRLDYLVSHTGTYYLKVSDALGRGGDGYRYRLRMFLR